MNETVNIRELNELIAANSSFISLITRGMDQRIGLSYEAEANNITADDVITDILDAVQVP